MAFMDLTLRVPEETADEPFAAPQLPPRRMPRIGARHVAIWIALGIGGMIAGLVFALAFAAIGEPGTAGIVTVVLLLPCASLLGGDTRRPA